MDNSDHFRKLLLRTLFDSTCNVIAAIHTIPMTIDLKKNNHISVKLRTDGKWTRASSESTTSLNLQQNLDYSIYPHTCLQLANDLSKMSWKFSIYCAVCMKNLADRAKTLVKACIALLEPISKSKWPATDLVKVSIAHHVRNIVHSDLLSWRESLSDEHLSHSKALPLVCDFLSCFPIFAQSRQTFWSHWVGESGDRRQRLSRSPKKSHSSFWGLKWIWYDMYLMGKIQ